MQVGDLIKPKEPTTFDALGYAIVTEHSSGMMVIFWIDGENYNKLQDYFIMEHMEIVCR